jgi:type II secretory pathway component PulJ
MQQAPQATPNQAARQQRPTQEQLELVNSIWEHLQLLGRDASAAAVQALVTADGAFLPAVRLRSIKEELRETYRRLRAEVV